MDQRALEYVAPYCDIKVRLGAVPLEARIRGVAYRSITAALGEAEKLEAYAERFGALRYESLAFYPLADYLVRLASAAAFLHSPAELYLGMAQITRKNAHEMSQSLLGQTLIHALASDPRTLIEQGLAMRRQICNYGRWDLLHHAPRRIEVHYTDEYIWIEQAYTYAALGTFDACRIKPRVTTRLDTPYSGSHHIEW
jgi:uncharacterized protein (TIGR02265 family)